MATKPPLGKRSLAASGAEGVVEVVGIETVLANLNARIDKIENLTRKGVAKATVIVLSEAQRLCPEDTTNLVKTGSARVVQTPGGPVGFIRFGASYAWFVHEIDRHYKKQGSQWKYLQAALFHKADRVVQVLADEARRALA